MVGTAPPAPQHPGVSQPGTPHPVLGPPPSPTAPLLAGVVGCGGVLGLSSHCTRLLGTQRFGWGDDTPTRAPPPPPGVTPSTSGRPACRDTSRPPPCWVPPAGTSAAPRGAAPLAAGRQPPRRCPEERARCGGGGAWHVPFGDTRHLLLHVPLGDVRHVPWAAGHVA